MPGRSIPLVTGEYYHIFNRGVNKQPIFSGTKTYSRCLDLINYYQNTETPVKFSTLIKINKELQKEIWDSIAQNNQKLVDVVCFCLMPNHFHLILKQVVDGGISKFMSNFQNSYSRYFNLKNGRSGPLLQGKFQAVRIEDGEQLLHVNRYIHLNPYTGYVVKELKQLENYPWSSLAEYFIESDKQITTKKEILDFFKTVDDYKKFLFDQADYQRKLNQIKHLILE